MKLEWEYVRLSEMTCWLFMCSFSSALATFATLFPISLFDLKVANLSVERVQDAPSRLPKHLSLGSRVLRVNDGAT